MIFDCRFLIEDWWSEEGGRAVQVRAGKQCKVQSANGKVQSGEALSDAAARAAFGAKTTSVPPCVGGQGGWALNPSLSELGLRGAQPLPSLLRHQGKQ